MSTDRFHTDQCPRQTDAGAYVLHALSTEEGADYGSHLGACTHCRSEVAELRLVVDTLPIAAPQVTPSPALKSRIMAVVDAESELLLAAGPDAEAEQAHSGGHEHRGREQHADEVDRAAGQHDHDAVRGDRERQQHRSAGQRQRRGDQPPPAGRGTVQGRREWPHPRHRRGRRRAASTLR